MESKATMSFLDPKLPQYIGISTVGAIFRAKNGMGRNGQPYQELCRICPASKVSKIRNFRFKRTAEILVGICSPSLEKKPLKFGDTCGLPWYHTARSNVEKHANLLPK